MTTTATPPHNLEAETAIIGCILLDPTVFAEVAHLKPAHFYHHRARRAWQAMLSLREEGTVPDLVTVGDWIDNHETTTEPYDDMDWLSTTVTYVVTTTHATEYAQVVLRHAQARALIQVAGQIAGLAYHGNIDEAMALGTQQIARIDAATPMKSIRSYREILASTEADVLARQQGTISGLKTGFAHIDQWLTGFEPGDLVLLAGRPGSGKSAMGLSMARRIAGRMRYLGQRAAVDIVTMEMSAISQARRLIASRAGGSFSTGAMRRGFRTTYDAVDVSAYDQFLTALHQEMEDAGDHLFIRDDVVTTDQLNTHVMQAKQQRGLQLLVVDQLNLMADEHRDETQRIGRMSAALKRIAQRHQIVILCLTQLNREVEKRSDHRPILADLRQSGELEQNADIVMGVYRPAYYQPPEPDDPPYYAEYAELLGLKYRDGETNVSIPVRFIPVSATFTDWTMEVDLDTLVAAKEHRS